MPLAAGNAAVQRQIVFNPRLTSSLPINSQRA